jgi:ribosomal protein S18 acetylase RimI-like enzyme
MTGLSYRELTTADVPQISSLHLMSLQEGLLHALEDKYTYLFYEIGFKSKNCFGVGALNEKNELIGVAITTKNIRDLHKKLLLNPSFVWGLVKKINKIWKLYPAWGSKMEVKQEFILFFVNQRYRNLYCALELMKFMEEKVKEKGFSEYSLEVNENNKVANLLYQRFGFKETNRVGPKENRRIFYKKNIL